jgi:hypothetical protein
MLPQRSQYFSSILCGREDSNFAIIVFYPFFRHESPGDGEVAEFAGDGLPASHAKMPATGLDFFFEGLFPNERLRRSLVGLPCLARSIGSDYCFGFDQIT